MKIGDEVYVHGYVDEIRSDVVIIRNDGGYFGTVPSEVNCSENPNNSLDKDTNVRSKDCETCKHDLWHTPRMCGKCVRQEDGKPSMYEPKTEPTCDTCRHKGVEGCEQPCLGCGSCGLYEAMTENDKLKEKVVEFIKSCARCKHRPIGAMMCEESCHYESKTEPYFSNPTAEEMKCVNDYIRSISKPTGVNIFDFMDEPQTIPIKRTMTGSKGERVEYTEAEMVVRDEPQMERKE